MGSNKVLDPGNEGRLVYVKGRIEVTEPLTEPEYGVAVPAVRLKRRVQMYQWVELQEEQSAWWTLNIDDVPPISYVTTWKDRLVDSSMFIKPFGHANPKVFPVESGVSVSDTVKVGAFFLSPEIKHMFNSFTLVTSDQRPDRRDIKMHSGLYYHSFDVWNPEVGDTRVQLSYAGAADDMVTLLGRQVKNTLEPFYIDNKDMTTVLEGEHMLSDILSSKFPSSGVWLIRFPSYFAIYCAYSSLTFILYKAGKRSRLIRAFVNNNKALLCHVFSAITLFIVTGMSWLPYSPRLGVFNLLAAFLLASYCFFKGHAMYYYLDR